MARRPVWEAVVVGGGPAGLAAGLHLARAGYSVLLIEQNRLGGQARLLGRIENYPGFPSGIDGGRLMDRWVAQAKRWGLRTRRARVCGIGRNGGGFVLRIGRGRLFMSRTVIYCPGAAFRRVDFSGGKKIGGRGLFHAALDRASHWRGKTVVVAGGGEAAVHQALALARYARRVYVVCRAESFKAHRLLLQRLKESVRIVEIFGATVCRIHGRRRLEALEIAGRDGRLRLETDALFILVGKAPAKLPFPANRMPPGFFVAGDAQGDVYRQVAVAAGSGIQAAMRCIESLEGRT